MTQSTMPTCLTIVLIAPAALGGGITLLDQIGTPDGGAIDQSQWLASQYFGAGLEAYDVAAVDDFDNPQSYPLGSIEMVITGWNGYGGLDAIQGLRAEFYSSLDAAGAQLVGDLAHGEATAPIVGDPAWALAGSDLVEVVGEWDLQTDSAYAAIVPINEYTVNGQTACAVSTIGDGLCWQSNPGNGFGQGELVAEYFNLAYRINGVGDACDLPLGQCPQDMTGVEGVPDGVVNVNDLLAAIGNYGSVGDGTARPLGDCFPPPSGDCAVTVDDLLELVSTFGTECEIVTTGSCCWNDGTCTEDGTEADCTAQDGTWLGPFISCDICQPPSQGACCNVDQTGQPVCTEGFGSDCESAGGVFQGSDTSCDTVICIPPPSNDLCENAVVAFDGDTPFDITWAWSNGPGISGSKICDLGIPTIANDIWFTWTAPENCRVTVSLCDAANFDSVLALMDGCDGAVLACNDDSEACGDHTSELIFDSASGGETYLVRVGAFSEGYGTDRTGTLTISWEPTTIGACCMESDCLDSFTPQDCEMFGGTWMGNDSQCADTSCLSQGDTCQTALPFLDGPNAFDSTGSTDSGHPHPEEWLCSDTGLNWTTDRPDLWGQYTPPGPGFVDISMCDPDSFDTSIAIYEGVTCGSMTQIACNGDGPFQTGCQNWYSSISGLEVDGTENLFIRIAGFQGEVGPGTCTITWYATLPTGACCKEGDCEGVITQQACSDLGGTWYEGDSCAAVTCQQPHGPCASGTGLDPLGPSEAWIATVSDPAAQMTRAAAVTADSVSSCLVAGLALQYDVSHGHTACTNAPALSFEWSIRADSEGTPGAILASGASTSHLETTTVYASAWPMHTWTFSPGFGSAAAWLTLASQAGGETDCMFYWLTASPEGDGISAIHDGVSWHFESFDLNYCITE